MSRLLFCRSIAILIVCLLLLPGVTAQDDADPATTENSISIIQSLYRLENQAVFDSWTPARHTRAAEIYMRIDDPVKAAAHLEAALVLQADNAQVLQRLAETYITLERWTPALDTLRQLLALRPDDTWANVQLGLILAPFNPADAQTYLERGIAGETLGLDVELVRRTLALLRDGQAFPALPIGGIYFDQGEWTLAELAFRHAVDLGQPYAEALASVALARLMQGKASQSWLDQALAADADNAQVQYLAGQYHRLNRDYIASIRAFNEALSSDPMNPVIYAEIANVYGELGDLAARAYWLSQAVLVSGNDPLYREPFDELMTLTASFFNNPSSADDPEVLAQSLDVQAALGWALYVQGDTEVGLNEVEAVLDRDPANAHGLYYRASIAVLEEDLPLARELLGQVIEADGIFAEEAADLLASLGQP